MKHKIINYVILLILAGCSYIVSVWAGSTDKSAIIPPYFKQRSMDDEMELPALTTRLGFKSRGRWFTGQVVNLDLYAYDMNDIRKFRMDLRYNPQQLKLVNVSRGDFLVEDQGLSEWNSGDIDEQNGLAANISGIRNQSFSGKETILIRLDFIVIGSGNGRIMLENSKIVSSNGIERTFAYTPLQYQIEQGD